MKRLTKSQYEMVARDVYLTRKEILDNSNLPEDVKAQRLTALEQLMHHLYESFNFQDEKFDYNRFYYITRSGITD